MFNAYFSTTSPTALAHVDKAKSEFDAWRLNVLALVQEWGFTDYQAHCFESPTVFAVACNESVEKRGPKLPGFTGGKREQLEGHDFFTYGLSPSKVNADKKAQISHLMAAHRKPELDSYWPNASYEQLACIYMGVATKVYEGVSIYMTTLWVLDTFDKRTLVIGLPMNQNESGIYTIPEMPAGWKEIDNRELARLFNTHNHQNKGDNK